MSLCTPFLIPIPAGEEPLKIPYILLLLLIPRWRSYWLFGKPPRRYRSTLGSRARFRSRFGRGELEEKVVVPVFGRGRYGVSGPCEEDGFHVRAEFERCRIITMERMRMDEKRRVTG
jgi:hypothetical protein